MIIKNCVQLIQFIKTVDVQQVADDLQAWIFPFYCCRHLVLFYFCGMNLCPALVYCIRSNVSNWALTASTVINKLMQPAQNYPFPPICIISHYVRAVKDGGIGQLAFILDRPYLTYWIGFIRGIYSSEINNNRSPWFYHCYPCSLWQETIKPRALFVSLGLTKRELWGIM